MLARSCVQYGLQLVMHRDCQLSTRLLLLYMQDAMTKMLPAKTYHIGTALPG